jgi:outer membrane protein assembly factor BamB
MVLPKGRRGWGTAGALVALAGVVLVAATVARRWGHGPYGLGVALVAIGCVVLVVAALRHRVARAVVGAAVGAALVAGGVLALGGAAGSLPGWHSADADLSEYSARVDDLLVSGATAFDVRTGDVVWAFPDDDADPLLVGPDVVVLGTDDETVAVETTTGNELWRSPVAGPGIATDGDVLVVSHQLDESTTEAVGLDLTTGETRWQRAGRPVMECRNGPVNRYAVAPETPQVLVVADEGTERTEVVAVADGRTGVADVDCAIAARVTDGVLLEGVAGALRGRSLTDGAVLWTTRVDQPWAVEGNGPQVVVPRDAEGEVTVVDTRTGAARVVQPPVGRARPVSGIDPFRGAAVWLLLDLESGSAVWNPLTDAVVEIPDADSLSGYTVDVHSGWTALEGRTRDLSGDATPQCWALSPDGAVFGPANGPGCYVDEGLLRAGVDLYPVA